MKRVTPPKTPLNQEKEAEYAAGLAEMGESTERIERFKTVFGSLHGMVLATKAAQMQDSETEYAMLHAWAIALTMTGEVDRLDKVIRDQKEFIDAVNQLTMSDNKHAMMFAAMLAKRYLGPNLVVIPGERGTGAVS